jgi:hypothetical protein
MMMGWLKSCALGSAGVSFGSGLSAASLGRSPAAIIRSVCALRSLSDNDTRPILSGRRILVLPGA